MALPNLSHMFQPVPTKYHVGYVDQSAIHVVRIHGPGSPELEFSNVANAVRFAQDLLKSSGPGMIQGSFVTEVPFHPSQIGRDVWTSGYPGNWMPGFQHLALALLPDQSPPGVMIASGSVKSLHVEARVTVDHRPAPPCKCGMQNEYATSNQPDGSYVCYNCRVRL